MGSRKQKKGAEGWFFPGTPFWRVNRELVLGLLGTRALLLELAHPLIAAGVARHSDFQRRPLKRLYQTMRQMTRITFGGRRAAAHALQHIQRCHYSVRGTLGEPSGAHSFGCRYAANDGELKLWVLATLIDSSLTAYELFITPLRAEEKESYYQDGRRLGRLLGVPESLMPERFPDFRCYVESMLSGDTLAVGSDARKVVGTLMGPTLLGRIVRLSSFASVGLLPPRFREEYGLSWNENQQRRMLQLAAMHRRTRRWLPDVLCVNPHAWLSEMRWRVGNLAWCRRFQQAGRSPNNPDL